MNKWFFAFLRYCRTSWTAKRRFNSCHSSRLFASHYQFIDHGPNPKEQTWILESCSFERQAKGKHRKFGDWLQICTNLIVQTSSLKDPSRKAISSQDNPFPSKRILFSILQPFLNSFSTPQSRLVTYNTSNKLRFHEDDHVLTNLVCNDSHSLYLFTTMQTGSRYS